MKVLMVSPSYGLNIGGAEIQLNKLQKRLDNFKPNKELPKKGVLSKYSKSVQSASLGAITD